MTHIGPSPSGNALGADDRDLAAPCRSPLNRSAPRGPADAAPADGLHAAVHRLLTRMRADGLWLRRDPTDRDSAILVRPASAAAAAGPGVTSLSLGAGRVAWSVVTAAVEAGLLREGAGRRIEAVEPGERNAPVVSEGMQEPAADERDGGRVAAAESPLAWLHRRRGADGQPLIDDAAFAAGERLRRDVTLAALLPSVTQNWARADGSASTGGFDPAGASDATVAARQRVRGVYAVLGARTGDFLVDVCAFLVPLQEAERRRGWPARSGKLVLGLALGQLAAHYGIAVEARGPERRRRGGAWRADTAPASIAEVLAGRPPTPQGCGVRRS